MATIAEDLIQSVFRRRVDTGGQIARNVSRYTLALCELVEAEGRDLRRNIINTGMGLGLLLVVAVLLITAFGFILNSAYLALLGVMSEAPAALCTGLLTLGVAGICALLAKKVSRT